MSYLDVETIQIELQKLSCGSGCSLSLMVMLGAQPALYMLEKGIVLNMKGSDKGNCQ